MTATARRCAYGCDHLAAHGSQVCPQCETFTERTLADLAQTYADLIDPRLLQLPGRSGGDKPPMVGDRAVEGRAQIRGVLVTWCKLLEDDHRIGPPADDVADMAAHVLRHHLRILASDAAEALVTDCADLARITAWPARWTGVRFTCPCGGSVAVTVETAGDMLTCPGCGESGVLDWWRDRVAAGEWRPMLLREVTEWLLVVHRLEVSFGQVRNWVWRERIDGYMADDRGRVLYDPDALLAVALKMLRRAA